MHWCVVFNFSHLYCPKNSILLIPKWGISVFRKLCYILTFGNGKKNDKYLFVYSLQTKFGGELGCSSVVEHLYKMSEALRPCMFIRTPELVETYQEDVSHNVPSSYLSVSVLSIDLHSSAFLQEYILPKTIFQSFFDFGRSYFISLSYCLKIVSLKLNILQINTWKKCSVALVIQKMQIKTTLRFHCCFTPERIASIMKSNNNKCWGCCEEKGTFSNVDGNADWCKCCGNQFEDSTKN